MALPIALEDGIEAHDLPWQEAEAPAVAKVTVPLKIEPKPPGNQLRTGKPPGRKLVERDGRQQYVKSLFPGPPLLRAHLSMNPECSLPWATRGS